MAAPTTSWNLVRLYGTWLSMNGALCAGTYKITVPARITNHTDDTIIPAGVYASGALQTAVTNSPSLDVMVPATDDPDNDQTNWNLQVEITFTGALAGEKYSLTVPIADRPVADGGTGIGVNLRTVALSAQLPQTAALYRVGVPGGLARLDQSGKVVDSNGDPVSVDPSSITPASIGAQPAGDYATNTSVNSGLAGKVPTTRTVAGKALSANVTLAAGDVGAVPTTRLVAGKALSADVTLAATDVGAAPTSHTHTAAQVIDFTTSVDARVQNIVGAAPAALDTLNELASALGNDANFSATVTNQLAGKVPTTRLVAGKALSADVTLAASDVGAVPTGRSIAGLALSGDLTVAALLNALGINLTKIAEIVQWDKTGRVWPAYSSDPTRVRQFYSQDDTAATAPTFYNPNDDWFKAAS